jgi:hypothetical protein
MCWLLDETWLVRSITTGMLYGNTMCHSTDKFKVFDFSLVPVSNMYTKFGVLTKIHIQETLKFSKLFRENHKMSHLQYHLLSVIFFDYCANVLPNTRRSSSFVIFNEASSLPSVNCTFKFPVG